MPVTVFGNSNSNDNNNKIDTSLFVQKPYLGTKNIEADIGEDIDLKNQYKFISLPDPTNIQDACNNNFVDVIFRNDTDFNDVKLENIKFAEVNYSSAIGQHLTPKVYVDNAIDEISLVRSNEDNDLSNYNLTKINSIILNKQAANDIEVIRKAYVDHFHQENERSRRDVGLDFYNESSDSVKNNHDNDLNENNFINLVSITVNREPKSDNELSKKKYVDESIGEGTILRFVQTLENYLKVSVGNTIYSLTKYNKIQIADTTIIISPNTGGCLLQKWDIKCNDKNNNGKIQNFIRSTRKNSGTPDSGATSIPPISNAFMYVETSSNNHGANVYCSW